MTIKLVWPQSINPFDNYEVLLLEKRIEQHWSNFEWLRLTQNDYKNMHRLEGWD
jgi:hypothetical protein